MSTTSKTDTAENPLLDFTRLPRFDDIRVECIQPALATLLQQANQAIAVAERVTPVTWETFVEPLAQALEHLRRTWSLVSHLQSVSSQASLREIYNAQLPQMTRFYSQLEQNLALYEQYKRLTQTDTWAASDAARKQAVANTLRDFRLGGAQLALAGQAQVRRIQEQLSTQTARFAQNLLDATDAWSWLIEDATLLSGLPAHTLAQARQAAAQVDGQTGWKLTLQAPCYLAVMSYADHRAVRQQLYRAFHVRASDQAGKPDWDNTEPIRQIVTLRQQLARCLGFANYVDYSLATKMADSAQQVREFLLHLAERARPFADQERIELATFAKENLGLDCLHAWDISYTSEKLRQARFTFSEQEVRQYFTEPRVLAGLFHIIHSLFGVRVEPDQAPTWHPDVRFYRLVNAQGQMLGQFYLDLYAREGKRAGAWMDGYRDRCRSGQTWQKPVAYLVCNFARGYHGQPATLSHQEVMTLFHEMGHGLHQLLTEVDVEAVAGINGVEWDAVELPSQMFENFCWRWEYLQLMTAHIETGQPLPRELFERMCAARHFQSGLQTLRQIEFALFDLLVHEQWQPDQEDIMAVLARVRRQIAVLIPPEWTRFPHQFSHIFAGGYAAGYYSYKWAEVLSADAYAAFEEESEQLDAIGARFRREILARGGSRSAKENFLAFRQRMPTIDALLRHSGLHGPATS